MQYEEAVQREIKKLARRRVTTGWWAGLFNMINPGFVRALKAGNSHGNKRLPLAFENFAANSIISLFLSLFIFLVILCWKSFTGQDIRIFLSDLPLVVCYGVPFVCFWLRPLLLASQPAPKQHIYFFDSFLKDHPEFFPTATRWATRRGFLTERDIHLICVAQGRAQTLSKHYPVSFFGEIWQFLLGKIRHHKSVMTARKQEREGALKGTLLGAQVEASLLGKSTQEATAEKSRRL